MMLLERRQVLVKERVGFAKLTDVYDLFDPESGHQIGVAREEPAAWAKYLRLIVNKQFFPTTLNVYESEGDPPVLSIHKGVMFWRTKVSVVNGEGEEIGAYRSKLFSLGGGFLVDDAEGRQVAEVKGDWKGWNFRLLTDEGRELGLVTKKWAGIAKEMFTSADTYVISLSDEVPSGGDTGALLLAAGLAIDVVFKEGK